MNTVINHSKEKNQSQFLKFNVPYLLISEVKNWVEPKVEFVERSKLNLLNEKEKEIQKLYPSEDDFWKIFIFSFIKT